MNRPNRTELHRHLDAAFRPATLAELTRKLNLTPSFETAEEVQQKFWVTKQRNSLKEVLDCFSVFQKAMATEEILERISYEAAEDVYHEGTEAVELRYSPSFVSEYTGLDWNLVLRAIVRGLDRARKTYPLQVGLICIVSRDYGETVANQTIDFAMANSDSFIGVDLAGNEALYPNKLFKSAFTRVHHSKLKITIHAGEALGPESVWDALDILGAHRIGHGTSSIHDSALMNRLSKDKILLETCPSSNYICKAVTRWKDHPLPKFLEHGIPVSISTDDPGIFGVRLQEEYKRVQTYLGLSTDDLKKIDQFSNTYSFLKFS